jgi:hypothetical protein
MRRGVGKALPADRSGATDVGAGAPGRRAHNLALRCRSAGRTNFQGEASSFIGLGNSRIWSAHCRSQIREASLPPFKRQLADESITSLGKSVDDLPPLPCGLP